MSILDDYQRNKGSANPFLTRPQPNVPAGNAYAPVNYLQGALASMSSAIPEFAGAEPTQMASAFRAQNPVSGFVTELLPTLVPYVGAFKLSRVPRIAEGLEAATGKVVSEAAHPVLHAAAKEMIRYTPVEVGRLAAGSIFYPENLGELFADVGLSYALTGGLGGVGGLFRLAGTVKPPSLESARVRGTDVFAAPMMQVRAAMQEGAEVTGGFEAAEVLARVRNEALEEVAPRVAKQGDRVVYAPIVQPLVGGSDVDRAAVTALLKSNSKAAKERGLSRRKLNESEDADFSRLNSGEQAELIGELQRAGASVASIDDIAANAMYPRRIDVLSQRAAPQLSKIFESPAWQRVDDDTLMAMEQDGLAIIAKRLRRGAEATEELAPITPEQQAAVGIKETRPKTIDAKKLEGRSPDLITKALQRVGIIDDEIADEILRGTTDWKTAVTQRGYTWKSETQAVLAPEPAVLASKRVVTGAGPLQIREGDRWFIAKTDRPGVFVPGKQAIAEGNIARWARWGAAFQPRGWINGDVFNRAMDEVVNLYTPMAFEDLKRLSSTAWKDKYTKELAGRIADVAGLKDAQSIRSAVDWAYDVFKPTMFQEHQDSTFGRLFATLKTSMRTADSYINNVVHGKVLPTSPSIGRTITGRKIEHVSGFNNHRPLDVIWRELAQDPEDFRLVLTAAWTKTPAEKLAQLTENGVVSARAATAVRELQAIDEDILANIVRPALETAGDVSKYEFLRGYITPRIYKGDFRQIVRDESNKPVWVVAAKNATAAKKQTAAILEEAAKVGRTLKADVGDMRHVLLPEADDLPKLDDIIEQVGITSAADEELGQVFRRAMRRTFAQNAWDNTGLPRNPGFLKQRNVNKIAVGDIEVNDVIDAVSRHYQKLARFSGAVAWQERFGPLAMHLKKNDATLYANIMRKANQYLGREGQITNTLNKTLAPILGPVMGAKAATKLAAATNELLYYWQLGFVNPTFALLNALSPLQTVLPHLAFTLNAPRGDLARLMQFVPAMDAQGAVRGTMGVFEPMKLMWQAVGDLRKTPADTMQMLTRMVNDGSLAPQLFEEWVGANARAGATLRESFERGGYLQWFKDGSTWMSRKSEQFARMVSATAGIRAGKAIGLQDEQLYKFAQRFVETTNYNYSVVDRSRIFTGPVGSMFGLFKNWQMHFMGMMLNYTGVGWKSNTWSPLLWQMSAATALGGLGAIPLRHLADGLASFHEKNSNSYLWLQNNWAEGADEVWFGLPAFLGVSLQASGSLPGTDVRNEITHLGSFVVWERAKQLGKALGAAYTFSDTTGRNPLENPNIRDQIIGATMPRGVFRAVSAIEGDYVKSMATGHPQVRDLSPAEQMMHGMGLNMVNVERMQVASRLMWEDQQERRRNIQGLGEGFAQARIAGDRENMTYIAQRAAALGVLEQVMRSATTRERREESGDLTSRFDTTVRAKYGTLYQQ